MTQYTKPAIWAPEIGGEPAAHVARCTGNPWEAQRQITGTTVPRGCLSVPISEPETPEKTNPDLTSCSGSYGTPIYLASEPDRQVGVPGGVAA